MFETFNIHSKNLQYAVKIGSDYIIADSSLSFTEGPILIDKNLANLWPSLVNKTAIEIKAIEELKTLDTASQIIEQLRLRGANRGTRVYSIGGGIIQDLSTFVASIYMRGIEWIYCPTTFLSMVDSCVGGKSSINVGRFKNIVGNYYPPKEVWIDVAFCRTLSLTDKISGLCEAVKICYADDGFAFDRYLELVSNSEGRLSEQFFIDVINLTLKTKKNFIEEDEFDTGIRLLLNFGHTFGHALEVASKFSITHGVAVGLGILAEARLAAKLNGWKNKSARLFNLESYIIKLLGQVPNLNLILANLSLEEAMQAFKSDKKHDHKSYFVIMPKHDGFLDRVNLPITGTDELILNIFSDFKKGIGI